MMLVTVAGGQHGLRRSYASAAAATVVSEVLSGV
jgi:hypothetical protein